MEAPPPTLTDIDMFRPTAPATALINRNKSRLKIARELRRIEQGTVLAAVCNLGPERSKRGRNARQP